MKHNLDNAIIIESPQPVNKQRNFRQYNAKWILDLYSLKRSNDPIPTGPMADLMYYPDTPSGKINRRFDEHNRHLLPPDSRRYQELLKWSRENYPKEGVFPKLLGAEGTLVEHLNLAISEKNTPNNYMSVWLSSDNPIGASVEFVKKLVDFLYISNL